MYADRVVLTILEYCSSRSWPLPVGSRLLEERVVVRMNCNQQNIRPEFSLRRETGVKNKIDAGRTRVKKRANNARQTYKILAGRCDAMRCYVMQAKKEEVFGGGGGGGGGGPKRMQRPR
ncbi:hypothetical protein LZ32DRAFT_375735 [Colletotrichum eremochloae]|nr:hypothetical protein LZ32DRAFT_375735 [Colletotrichum eremochloae]